MKVKIEINYHVDDETFNEVLQETGLDKERLEMMLQEIYLEQAKKQNVKLCQTELSVEFESDEDEFGDIQVGYA